MQIVVRKHRILQDMGPLNQFNIKKNIYTIFKEPVSSPLHFYYTFHLRTVQLVRALQLSSRPSALAVKSLSDSARGCEVGQAVDEGEECRRLALNQSEFIWRGSGG